MNASSDDDDDSDDEDALDISDNVCYLQGRPQIISDDRLIAARIRIATAFDEADDNDEESDEEPSGQLFQQHGYSTVLGVRCVGPLPAPAPAPAPAG